MSITKKQAAFIKAKRIEMARVFKRLKAVTDLQHPDSQKLLDMANNPLWFRNTYIAQLAESQNAKEASETFGLSQGRISAIKTEMAIYHASLPLVPKDIIAYDNHFSGVTFYVVSKHGMPYRAPENKIPQAFRTRDVTPVATRIMTLAEIAQFFDGCAQTSTPTHAGAAQAFGLLTSAQAFAHLSLTGSVTVMRNMRTNVWCYTDAKLERGDPRFVGWAWALLADAPERFDAKEKSRLGRHARQVVDLVGQVKTLLDAPSANLRTSCVRSKSKAFVPN